MKILSVAKAALYGIFLHYYCIYTLRGSFIPGATVLLFGLACLCVGYDLLGQRRIYLGTEVKCWVLYAALAFITTALVTMDSSSITFVGDIVKFAQRLVIIMMIAYICEREGNIRFGLRLMAVTAIACSVSILMVLDDFTRKLSITTAANLSANDVGAIMAFGCYAIIFAWGRREHSSLLLSCLKIAACICCVVVIFLAGSRKSIGAIAVLAVMLLVLCLPDYGRHLRARKILIVLVAGTAAYLFITEYLLQYVHQTNLYERLLGTGADTAQESDQTRLKYYIWALEHFADHPIAGIGFNMFRKYHGNYTHSTYAEPLACSGIIGLLYLYPYYTIVKKQLYLIFRNKPGSYARLKQKELFAYLCMFLFVGIGIPYMYKDVPCILLGTFIASQAISFRELRARGVTSAEY